MPDPSSIKAEENFVVLAIIFLTILIVGAVTYSVYLFIDLTHVSNAANVHVTKSLTLAAQDAQGKLYNNPDNGIFNWLVYTDQKNGFEIKYPNDLQKQTDGSHLLALKKYSAAPRGVEYLKSVIYVDVKDVSDSTSLRDELSSQGIAWQEKWKQEDIGGKPGINTGAIKDESGTTKDLVVWEFGSKIFTVEINCFDNAPEDDISLFNKIISEFSFI